VISLLENDPDTPGRLKLNWERTYSDGSPLVRAEGGMNAADLQARDFANLVVRSIFFTMTLIVARWSGKELGGNFSGLGICFSSFLSLTS
jgi:hypothetical protein